MSYPIASIRGGVVVQSGVTFQEPATAAVNLVVFALLSALAAGGLTVAYRWYFKTLLPEGIAILAGVAVVALYINTASLGVVVTQGSVDLFRPGVVVFNVVALGASTIAAPIGRRIGDTVAAQLFSLVGLGEIDAEMSTMVRSVGRVTSLRLPAEIQDMESYDPVTEETKADLAGKTLAFPRRLTVEELRSRLVTRLKEDYGVGYVDVDLTAEGTVEYLAVGSRAAGVGATIAPGTVAVAIRADPPNNATSGDQVQIWSTGDPANSANSANSANRADPTDPAERLTSGELRGVAGDVVTLAIDEADASLLSPADRYRLVTMPAEPRADREFATLLRGVDETMGTVTIAADSTLVGETAEAVTAAVLAVRPAEGVLTTLPEPTREFAAGETIYVLARPDVLRQLEGLASAPAEADSETDDGAGDGTDGEPIEGGPPDGPDLDDSE